MADRALVLALLVACSANKTPPPPPPPAPAPAAPGSAALSDTEVLDRWFAAMEKQLAADAHKLVTQAFASRAEAEQALMSLTPAGFHARPEYFADVFAAAGPPDALAKRLAAHAAAHGDDMERRANLMLAHLKPVMEQVYQNVQRQFPR